MPRERARRAIGVLLGAASLACVAALLAWDASPRLFPPRAHDLLGALPLVLIAIASLAGQVRGRPEPRELLKATLLASAFLFWAANQLWPDGARATLYNDLAIALFVLDLFLVIVGWPGGAPGGRPAGPSGDRSPEEARAIGHRE